MRTLLIALLLCSAASADVVHLRNGGKIQGIVTEEGGLYKVDTGHGMITLKKEEVERIEKKEFTKPDKPVIKKTPPRLRESFAHPFYGYKVYLPAGWMKGPDKEQAKNRFYGPKEQMYTPHVDLMVQVTKMALPDYVNEFKKGLGKAYADCLFMYEEAISVRGRESYQFLLSFSDGPVKMRAVWTIVSFENRLTIMGFACTDAWFDRYYSPVDASMRSLRLYPLPAAPLEQRKEFDKHYQQGYSLWKEGKIKDGLASFQKAAALIPEFADIHGICAQLYVKLGNLADAEKSLRKALEIDAEDYDLNYNLGVILVRQEKWEGAIEALSAAVKSDPQMEPALTNLGVAFIAKAQYDKAAATLQKAVEADPESAPAHYNLGMAFVKLGRKAEAKTEFKETLKLDPKHAAAKKELAELEK